MKPINQLHQSDFVISSPRSGSTWFSSLLNCHPEVGCVERRLFGDYADMVTAVGKETPRLRVTLDKYINSMLMHYKLDPTLKNSLIQTFIEKLITVERNQCFVTRRRDCSLSRR